MFFLVIILMILSIALTVNVWKKSKRTRFQKILMIIIYWIVFLIIELILINVYFAMTIK